MVDVLRDAILEVVRLSDKVFDTNFAAQLSEKWSTYLPYSAGPATREEVNDARRRVEAQRKKDEERRRLDEEKREKRRQVSSGAAAIRQEKETAYVRDKAARQAMQVAEDRQRQMEEAEWRHLDAYKKMLDAEEKLGTLQDRMAEERTRELAEKNIESAQLLLDALSEQESQSRREYGFDVRDAIRLMSESNVDRFRRRDRRIAESIQDKIARGNAGEKVRFTKREKAMIREQMEIQKAQEEKKRQLQETRDAEARRQQEMTMQAAENQISMGWEQHNWPQNNRCIWNGGMTYFRGDFSFIFDDFMCNSDADEQMPSLFAFISSQEFMCGSLYRHGHIPHDILAHICMEFYKGNGKIDVTPSTIVHFLGLEKPWDLKQKPEWLPHLAWRPLERKYR